jgi:hypothetical protein
MNKRYEKRTKIFVGKPAREISFPRPNGNLGDHKKMYVKENSGVILWTGFKSRDKG